MKCRVIALDTNGIGENSILRLVLLTGILVLFYFIPCGAGLAQTSPQVQTNPTSTQRLSLAEAIQLVQTRNPLARAGAARVEGAEARLRGAGVLQNPTLTLAQPFGQNTGGLDEGTFITQTVELGDKRHQRVVASRNDRDASLADRTGTLNDLTLTAQNAYFEALRADAERTLAENALANAQAFAKAAQTQFEAGDVAQSNVIRSQIELNRAEQALTAADTDRLNRYATLKSLAQLPADTTLVLTDTLTYSPTAYALPNLLKTALENRPDLQSARKTLASREAALHGSRAQTQPDLLLEARRSTLDPTTGGNSLRVGVVFPLFDFGRVKSDSASAKAAVKEQQATLDETTRVAKLDVETAYRNLEQARKVVESFQNGRLDRSKRLLDMAQIGYAQGANTYLELLDAQQIYRTEQTDYARALTLYNEAKATLQRSIGGKLP